MNTKFRAGASSAQSYADDALETASHALDRAGDTVRELRSNARDAANRGFGAMAERAAAARNQLGHYVDATGRYAAEQPVKTALIAAAVGAVVAGAIIAARRYNNQR